MYATTFEILKIELKKVRFGDIYEYFGCFML